MTNIYEQGLDRNQANYVPLTPLSLLSRVERVYPDHPAVIHGNLSYSWRQTTERCRRIASALVKRGIGRGDTVAIIAPNTPAIFEAHFAVPMAGAVLNALNTRLDAGTLSFILEHGEAKAIITDSEFSPLMRSVLENTSRDLLVIDVHDPEGPGGESIGQINYDDFLASGDPDFEISLPDDEWDAIALNYTSGTTGNPKGVVYHHRGAYLNAISNIVGWNMAHHPVYLWTLPMFHCNGWCFPWTITLLAGTHVFMRGPTAKGIYAAFAEHGVTHLCGAPIIMSMIASAPDDERQPFDQKVRMMTAAAPPPAPVIEAMEAMGIAITHVYGLTEVYGPAVVCAEKPEWAALPLDEQSKLKARQGVAYELEEDVLVLDPETSLPVPLDGETQGEVVFRGNIVMKGYLKRPVETDAAFRDGWFWSGDLAVQHPDGYIEIRDRAKDIIISGGENISSIEVENALHTHPAVDFVAVVAMADEKWGETPCAFVELAEGSTATEQELLDHARALLAGFKRPKKVVFGPLPKTTTGKIRKNELRDRLRNI